jgi:hypothetical protein
MLSVTTTPGDGCPDECFYYELTGSGFHPKSAISVGETQGARASARVSGGAAVRP